MKRFVIAAALLCGLATSALAEEIKIATYNVEHWDDRFDARATRAWAKKLPQSEELTKLVDEHVKTNDKNNWAVSKVIEAMDADIVLFEEACKQEDLNYFGNRWLRDSYAILKQFPTNTGERNQHLCLIAKPGFKMLEIKDQYYLEKDPVAKTFATAERNGEAGSENRLFARGPAFVLMQSPAGTKFWVGLNHQKSKSGNSLDVTKWRNREAIRVHQIIKELEKTGPAEVVFGGDMNDELGSQEFEQQAGGDSITLIQGLPEDGVVLATRSLAEKNAVSYGGYFNERYRSFIDHFFVTQSLKDKIVDVKVINDGFAPMASDHFPVLMTLKF